MATTKDVEYWLLEYACRYHHYKVIEGITSRHNETVSSLELPPIRLALPAVMNIITDNRLEEFALAIEIVEDIYNSCYSIVPFRLYAQLTSALKIKDLFHLLISNREFILEKLNQYFPRSGLNYPTANQRTLSKLNSSSFEFRKFFLQLLANEKQRLSYLQSAYQKEFGENFLTQIHNLMKQFVTSIESLLPLTALEQLMRAVSSGVDVESKLAELGVQSARIEIILDAVANKTTLSSDNLLDILTMVSPMSSQDRVVPPHSMAILADHQDSEDSGTDQSPPLVDDSKPEMTVRSNLKCGSPSVPDLIHGRPDKLDKRLVSDVDHIEDDEDFSDPLLPGGHPGVTYANTNSTRDSVRLTSYKEKGRLKDLSAVKGKYPAQISHSQTRVASPLIASTPQHRKGEKRKNSSTEQMRTFSAKKVQNHVNHLNTNKSVGSNKKVRRVKPASDRGSLKSGACASETDDSSSEDSVSIDWSDQDEVEEGSVESCDDFGGRSVSDIDRSSQYDTSHDDRESQSEVISGSEETELHSSYVSSSGEIKSDKKTVVSEKDIYSQLISPYRKNSVLKLCVVKLYKKQKIVLHGQTGVQDFDLYT